MSVDDFMALDSQERATHLERRLIQWAKLIHRTKTWNDKPGNSYKAIAVQYTKVRQARAFGSSRLETISKQGMQQYNCLPLKIASLNLLSDGQLARFLPTQKSHGRLPVGEYVSVADLTIKEQVAVYKLIPLQFR